MVMGGGSSARESTGDRAQSLGVVMLLRVFRLAAVASLLALATAHADERPKTSFFLGAGPTGTDALGFDNAWGIIEVPALEVAPQSRRIEVYGTRGACVIPHLGSGHLANKNIQPIELYKAGDDDWQTRELAAATLQISDLREFAAVVLRRKEPDFGMVHDLTVQEALLRASGMA